MVELRKIKKVEKALDNVRFVRKGRLYFKHVNFEIPNICANKGLK